MLSNLEIARKVCLTLCLMIFIIIYIRYIHPEVFNRNQTLFNLALIAMISLITDWAFAWIFRRVASSIDIIPQAMLFLVLPLALPAMLVSVTYGFRAAVYVGLFVSGIAAFAMNESFPTLITGLFVSAVVGLAVRNTSNYKSYFVRAVCVCWAATIIMGIVFMGENVFRNVPEPLTQEVETAVASLKDPQAGRYLGIRVIIPEKISEKTYSTTESRLNPVLVYRMKTMMLDLFIMPVCAGIATALTAMLILFILESISGDMTTSMAYLTFTDRNHSLLKKLQLNASGTYHHSERVAALSECAAIAIGLDSRKLQACALFHDVGKLKHPDICTENNPPGANPLEGFSPQEAVSLIREHVTYGLELAKKYQLPKMVRTAIECHHGNDFVSYFYDKLRKEGVTDLDEKDFRYPGPLPVSKEISVLMLADSCQAAVQSINQQDRNPKNVTDMVASVFERKISRGQLSESLLTLGELTKIRKAFLDEFAREIHERISYAKHENSTVTVSVPEDGQKGEPKA